MQHVRKKKKKRIACREATVRSLLPISSRLSVETGKIAAGARKSGPKTGIVMRQPRSSMRGSSESNYDYDKRSCVRLGSIFTPFFT